MAPGTQPSILDRVVTVALISFVGFPWWFVLLVNRAFCADHPANLSACQAQSAPIIVFGILIVATDAAILIGKERAAAALLIAGGIVGVISTWQGFH